MIQDIDYRLYPLTLNKCLSKVPLCMRENSYALIVNKNQVRYFATDTLPGEVKIKLAMVLAKNDSKYVKEPWPMPSHLAVFYNCPTHLSEFRKIGWRYSTDYFCMVLTKKLLNSLKGETL